MVTLPKGGDEEGMFALVARLVPTVLRGNHARCSTFVFINPTIDGSTIEHKHCNHFDKHPLPRFADGPCCRFCCWCGPKAGGVHGIRCRRAGLHGTTLRVNAPSARCCISMNRVEWRPTAYTRAMPHQAGAGSSRMKGPGTNTQPQRVGAWGLLPRIGARANSRTGFSRVHACVRMWACRRVCVC